MGLCRFFEKFLQGFGWFWEDFWGFGVFGKVFGWVLVLQGFWRLFGKGVWRVLGQGVGVGGFLGVGRLCFLELFFLVYRKMMESV